MSAKRKSIFWGQKKCSHFFFSASTKGNLCNTHWEWNFNQNYGPSDNFQQNLLKIDWVMSKWSRDRIFFFSKSLGKKNNVLKNMGSPGKMINDTSIKETAAFIQKCTLFITNDSLLMHMAAALQIPTVAIYGPINVVCDGPYGTKHKIVSTSQWCVTVTSCWIVIFLPFKRA